MAQETPDGQQKTEEASGKRLGDARDKGQVAKSHDATSAAMLLFGSWIIYAYGKSLAESLMNFMRFILLEAPFVQITDSSVPHYFLNLILFISGLLLPLLAMLSVIVLAIEISQVGFHFATKKFTEGLNLASVFNPFTGIKRMFFSKNSWVEILKNSGKILMMAIVVYQVLSSKTETILTLMDMPFQNMATFMAGVGFEMVMKVSVVFAVLAAFDYIYQKRKFKEDMKMTKQEVKEETKQQEGDVQMKGRIRNIARQRLRKLMLKRVKEADVIITNPTHYAVAIVYKQGLNTAPVVVAKGVDFLALKIREIGTDNNIPIVEDPPLARALYASVEVEQQIPETLFKAVAQVLAYVYKLKRKR